MDSIILIGVCFALVLLSIGIFLIDVSLDKIIRKLDKIEKRY